MRLIIVESPKKARTLGSFAGTGYRVIATMGHVRDLPGKRLGVDVGNGFAPEYEVLDRAKRTLASIRGAARGAEFILLATDPDREGEAIAWHVAEALGLSPGRTARIVFHEISERALRQALATPRAIDQSLVDAQQARRVLDRLVGY
ncbi:MAG: DNA topoisomerase I, partial [Proteobacteria bacterium]|nr:DNA topoisomerase I [Pseudomonadota bacterium]